MIVEIKPNKGKAKEMMNLVEQRIKTLPMLKKTGFPSIVAETYYEVIKELSIILLLSKGFKSIGENFHKDLFDFLFLKKIFSPEEFSLVNDLRVRRNKSLYQGERISQNYLDVKQARLDEIIIKLKSILDLELKGI